jgi:hypothetical protein
MVGVFGIVVEEDALVVDALAGSVNRAVREEDTSGQLVDPVGTLRDSRWISWSDPRQVLRACEYFGSLPEVDRNEKIPSSSVTSVTCALSSLPLWFVAVSVGVEPDLNAGTGNRLACDGGHYQTTGFPVRFLGKGNDAEVADRHLSRRISRLFSLENSGSALANSR